MTTVNAYEEKRAKEREALDEKFKAAAGPLAERLIEEIKKAAGVKGKKTVHEGSHAIALWIDEPRITIEIEHDWGSGSSHWEKLPTGKPKILLNLGQPYGHGSKSWYRPGKDGTFNIEKIVKKVAEKVEGYKQGQEATRRNEIEKKENAALQSKELEGIKLPEGVIVQRNPGSGAYSLKFAGTFNVPGVKDVAVLAEALNDLVSKFEFAKSWRTDF